MPEDKPAEATNRHSAGTIADATALTDALRAVVVEILNLITLETRLAIRSMLVALLAFLGMFVLLATAWVGAMVALTLLFIHIGLLPILAVLMLVTLNLLLLPVLRGFIRRCLARLSYPVTRATLINALGQLRGSVAP